MSAVCSICGWAGPGRSATGACLDRSACLERYGLGQQGRPTTSLCKCAVWPCPCFCHGAHTPELKLEVDPSGERDDSA